jgi:hypothetical protein
MFARWFALMGAVTVGLFALPAAAGTADADATKLADKAVFEDYLNLRFGPAIKKLQKALTVCERGCSATVKARVFRDLGVVYVAKKERDSAIACFIEALTADPNLRLDQDLTSADAKKVFAEALAVVGETPTRAKKDADPGPADIDADAETAPAAEAEEDEGTPEIDHDVPKEQAINTPLPLYLEVVHAKASRLGKVELFYRPFGVKEFSRLPMKQHGSGWAAQISCQQIGTTSGNLVYYFVVHGKDGQPLVTLGSAEKPIKTAIKNTRKGEAPHLPDEEPPAACTQSTDDCPPDFPGCAPETNDELPEAEPTERPSGATPFWLSLTIQADTLFLPASKAACAPNATYGCYYGGGAYRDPNDIPAGMDLDGDGVNEGAGKVNGGIALGTLRVMLGGDYAFSPHVVAGIKLGFAFLGAPQEKTATAQGPAFLPLHAEARVSYWFGDGIGNGTIRPFAAISGGLAQVDARAQIQITDPAYAMDCEGQPPQCLERSVDAWRKTGVAFASVSGGALYAIGTDHGIFGELRLMQTFPEAGTVLALHAGYMMNLSALSF